MVNSNAELIQSEGETRVIEAFLAASISPPLPPHCIFNYLGNLVLRA